MGAIRLNDGYNYIIGMNNSLNDPTLSIMVMDGKIQSVSIHTRDDELLTHIYTPENVKTWKNTSKQTTNHSDGTTSKNNVVQLTFEEVIQ